MPVTKTREEAVKTAEAIETVKVGKNGKENKSEYPNLVQVLCIQYPITFWKKFVSVLTLFDSGSEVNAIYLTFTQELELLIKPTDVEAQKIDSIMLDTFGIVVTAFLVIDKANQVKFFKETLLIANISLKIVIEISFFILSGADIDFLGQKLW